MLLMAAMGKFTGAEPSVSTFEAIGWGDWFRYLVAVLEVAVAVCLLAPPGGRSGRAGGRRADGRCGADRGVRERRACGVAAGPARGERGDRVGGGVIVRTGCGGRW
ncbi:hypothetical protein ACFSTC_13410 [Nonomuraea ferruginea]